jgi:hypothetical protein
MKNNENIYDFLNVNGFRLIDKDTSTSFGDYYNVFTADNFELRFSSSKSHETVDIRSRQPNEEWYDLALVKALLYNEINLNKITKTEEYKEFLQKELSSITMLFNNKNYLTTKEKLVRLGNERAKQMFPGMTK